MCVLRRLPVEGAMTSSVNVCKRFHQIEVESVRESDKVRHNLLLIKGRLLPSCSSTKQLKATLALRHTQQEQLTQLSAVGEFKLLFDLKSEEQKQAEEHLCELQLSCCSGKRVLRFSYQPRLSAYRVQPLYLLCRPDGENEEEESEQVQRERCALIDLNLRLVQGIYAQKLHAAGYTNRTFSLNGPCCIFRSQLSVAKARACGEDELWQQFASEILACPNWGQQQHLKFVAFIGCTRYNGAGVSASGDYSYANIRRHLEAHAALGGGGLALFGSGHFYAWPRRFAEIGECIRSTKRVDVTRLPDESNYRRTYGGVFASTLGAVCHELGHCFDLGHTNDGVMGHGFDFLNRVLAIDQPTEHLPQRIVAAAASDISTSLVRPRFTQLKLKQTAGSKYLDNYHDQRRNDSFYFAQNCAVILAHHRWLRPDWEQLKKKTQDSHIKLLTVSREIVSSEPLRIIELRCNLNSFVDHYKEFDEKQQTHNFQLPEAFWDLLANQRTHYAFVLTIDGDTKRLSCDNAPK